MIFEKNLVSVLVNDTGAIIFEYKFVMNVASHYTAQKMKFSLKDFFSICDQMRRKLRIWSHLLKKSLTENFIFCTVLVYHNLPYFSRKLADETICWIFDIRVFSFHIICNIPKSILSCLTRVILFINEDRNKFS